MIEKARIRMMEDKERELAERATIDAEYAKLVQSAEDEVERLRDSIGYDIIAGEIVVGFHGAGIRTKVPIKVVINNTKLGRLEVLNSEVDRLYVVSVDSKISMDFSYNSTKHMTVACNEYEDRSSYIRSNKHIGKNDLQDRIADLTGKGGQDETKD